MSGVENSLSDERDSLANSLEKRAMHEFERNLHKYIIPSLESLGYLADGDQQDGITSFAFSKPLDDGSRVTVRFDRATIDDRPVGWNFRVWLWRRKHTQGRRYEGEIDISLERFLAYYNKREKANDFLHISSPGEYPRVLGEILNDLKSEAIPWLEDPQSRPPGYIDREDKNLLAKWVDKIYEPSLKALGYLYVEENTYRKNLPFTKQDRRLFAQVIIRTARLIARNQSSDRLAFQVEVGRLWMVKTRINNEDILMSEGTTTSIGRKKYYDPHNPSTISKTINWEYSTEVELQRHLRESLRVVVEKAIPWIEDPDSQSYKITTE